MVASAADGVAFLANAFYGYYPMSSHLLVKPARVGPGGFLDASEHRRELPAIYKPVRPLQHRGCGRTARDREAELAILRPLFATSFLLDDFLADNRDFGATRVLLSSASSKTAYGTAACLRCAAAWKWLIDFAEQRWLRQCARLLFTVVTYDALASLDPSVPTVHCDFAGNAALRPTSIVTARGIDLQLQHRWHSLGPSRRRRRIARSTSVLFLRRARPEADRRVGADGCEASGRVREHFITQVTSGPTKWLTVGNSSGQEAINKTLRHAGTGATERRLKVLRFRHRARVDCRLLHGACAWQQLFKQSTIG